jgi:hypothetical protein
MMMENGLERKIIFWTNRRIDVKEGGGSVKAWTCSPIHIKYEAKTGYNLIGHGGGVSEQPLRNYPGVYDGTGHSASELSY